MNYWVQLPTRHLATGASPSADRTATRIISLDLIEFVLPGFDPVASRALEEWRCGAQVARRTLCRIAASRYCLWTKYSH
jgi:hypothetical protein